MLFMGVTFFIFIRIEGMRFPYKRGVHIMKKFLRSLLAITLLLGIVSTTALAAEPRWRNVASISPSMSAYDGSYTSAMINIILNVVLSLVGVIIGKNILVNLIG